MGETYGAAGFAVIAKDGGRGFLSLFFRFLFNIRHACVHCSSGGRTRINSVSHDFFFPRFFCKKKHITGIPFGNLPVEAAIWDDKALMRKNSSALFFFRSSRGFFPPFFFLFSPTKEIREPRLRHKKPRAKKKRPLMSLLFLHSPFWGENDGEPLDRNRKQLPQLPFWEIVGY